MPLPRRLPLPILNFLLDFFPIPPVGFKECKFWFPSAISPHLPNDEEKIQIIKLESVKKLKWKTETEKEGEEEEKHKVSKDYILLITLFWLQNSLIYRLNKG